MGLVERMAKKVDKGYFLDQLKQTWSPMITAETDPEVEAPQAWGRIKASPIASAFHVIKVTEADIKQLIIEMVAEKRAAV